MGWNQGYAIMEESVIAVYDTGKLTKDILDAMMEPYKGTDCDTGGSRDLRSNTGLHVEEITCKIMEPEKYLEALTHPEWFQGEEPGTPNHDGWHSSKAACDLFRSIWRDRWNIW